MNVIGFSSATGNALVLEVDLVTTAASLNLAFKRLVVYFPCKLAVSGVARGAVRVAPGVANFESSVLLCNRLVCGSTLFKRCALASGVGLNELLGESSELTLVRGHSVRIAWLRLKPSVLVF